MASVTPLPSRIRAFKSRANSTRSGGFSRKSRSTTWSNSEKYPSGMVMRSPAPP